ncbi:MAG: (2Fe-2S) ferredoxin domain-containing protein [Bacteroidales bacterium]
MKKNPDFLLKDFLTGADEASLSKEAGKRLKILRHEDVEKLTVYIGAGTCGIGAGADRTMEAVNRYLEVNGLEADIVETGCIGLCSSEPIMDIQLPGRNRLSFEKVSEDLVDAILSSVLAGQPVHEDRILGQYYTPSLSEWVNVRDIRNHTFFKPQVRIVMANCG